MDSGNSNSMQSSSGGGDEEYDSRADQSISSFLNNNHPSSYPPPPAPAPAHHHHHHHHHTSLFDPLSSNYTFDPLSSSSSRLSSSTTNQNSLLNNLDMVWSKSLRSEPNNNCIDLGGGLFIPSTTSSSFSSSQALQQIPRGGGGVTEAAVPKASSSFLAMASGSTGLNIDDQAHVTLNNGHHHNNTTMVRNPKKRSRASRRAPTTVLTTDTTNFRAMVQEFTGIPAPPFTSSSTLFPIRTRLDLFGTSSSRLLSHLDYSSSSSPSSSSYNLLRPFAQKLINPFTSSNNSIIDAMASASASASTTANINMQSNSILNLHSLLQVPPKYPLSNSTIPFETKPPPPQERSLEELGLSHSNLMSGLQSWPGTGTGTAAGSAAVGSNENHEELGIFANGKLSSNNFSQVASSEFYREDKGQENVNGAAAATTTRTEGMVESWICSSD